MRRILFFLGIVFLLGCQRSSDEKVSPFTVSDLHALNTRLLEIAMEDGFSPPIASRVYVYPHLAYYITLQSFYPEHLISLTGKLRGLDSLEVLDKRGVHPELAANLAFCKIARKVVFSEHYMDQLITEVSQKARMEGLSLATIEASGRYADQLTAQMVAWINQDHYTETRTMDRWTSTKQPGKWIETPPDYQAGLESHWKKIRPFIIDSAGVYISKALPTYDPSKDSEFYKMVMAVYEQSERLQDEQKEIALYWDDNPNMSEHRGHSVTMIHKISPPGHWLNIIRQISQSERSDHFKATKAYTFTAIAMFDVIISCWHEKYKTNLVRPVTYIQENIDPDWTPLIQTPPFPEYTSGHSAISAAAATVLTQIYGANYPFTDSTEVIFGHPPRHFTSFLDAAWEVSLSRFYAGIHYMNGIEEGNVQGKVIGQYILDRLQ